MSEEAAALAVACSPNAPQTERWPPVTRTDAHELRLSSCFSHMPSASLSCTTGCPRLNLLASSLRWRTSGSCRLCCVMASVLSCRTSGSSRWRLFAARMAARSWSVCIRSRSRAAAVRRAMTTSLWDEECTLCGGTIGRMFHEPGVCGTERIGCSCLRGTRICLC